MSSLNLDTFEPSKAGKHDPGQIIILYDNRTYKSKDDKLSYYQNYYLEAMYALGRPAVYWPDDLEPGKLRLTWYTHAGNEGKRDFPLWQADSVKEMFDSLSDEGFRPMVIGWSAENPFPMIGGTAPPPPPKKVVPVIAKTWNGAFSGHGKDDTNPHDRIMAIIENEEQLEAKARKLQVEADAKVEEGGAA